MAQTTTHTPTIGAVIRAWRLFRGLTLTQLAARAGLRKGYLSEVEHDKRTNPWLGKLEKLAVALEISLQDIHDRRLPPGQGEEDDQSLGQGPQATSPALLGIAHVPQLEELITEVQALKAEVTEVKATVTELNSALQKFVRSTVPLQVPKGLYEELRSQQRERDASPAKRDQPQETAEVFLAEQLRRVEGRWEGSAQQKLSEGTRVTCMFSSESFKEAIKVPRTMTISMVMRLTLWNTGNTMDLFGAGELDIALSELGVEEAKTVYVNIRGELVEPAGWFRIRLLNSEDTSVRLYMDATLSDDGRTLSGNYHVERLFTAQTLRGEFALEKVEAIQSSGEYIRVRDFSEEVDVERAKEKGTPE